MDLDGIGWIWMDLDEKVERIKEKIEYKYKIKDVKMNECKISNKYWYLC